MPRRLACISQYVKPDSKLTISKLTLIDIPENTLLDFDLGAKRTKWTCKILHGRFPQQPVETGTDKEATQSWLIGNDMFLEKEDFMFVIKDEVVSAHNYLKYLIKDPNILNDICRLCVSSSRSIQHTILSCP
jgi:hypothetical protein